MKRWLLICLISFIAVATSRAAGPRYYFKLPPIVGGVTLRGHESEILATGFEFQTGSGGTFFLLQKNVDGTSTDLIQAIKTNTEFASGKFTAETSAGRPGVLFTIEFTSLIPNTSSVLDMGLTDPAPQEKVAFTFTTAVITTYIRQPGGTVVTKTVTITNNPNP